MSHSHHERNTLIRRRVTQPKHCEAGLALSYRKGADVADKFDKFVLGLDLDGCVADFLQSMREVFAEWSGQPIETLHPSPRYGFPEWDLDMVQYRRLHRFAVTQHDLFAKMQPVAGAPQALRRLSAEGVHIRIATHRLFIPYFHEPAASQTIRWLELHGIPYRDLCLIEDKAAVRADVFVEDSAGNIARLQAHGVDVLCFTNPSNVSEQVTAPRAVNWTEAEEFVRERYYQWRIARGLQLPPAPGQAPPDEDIAQPNELRSDE